MPITNIPVIGYPDYTPYTQITPFTVRDGATYLLTLEALKDWIRDVLVPAIDTNIAGLETAWETQTNSLVDQTNAIVASLIQDVNDAVDTVVNSSIELQDAVLMGIINNVTSDARVLLDSLYAAKTDVTTLQDLVNTGRLSDAVLTSARASAIDAALPDKVIDNTADLQAEINAAIGRGEAVLRLKRNAVYNVSAPIETSSTTDTTVNRRSIMLVGPATIKPINTFVGSAVIKHSQSAAQATANSLAIGAGLKDITIDGSSLIASNVSGYKIDGAWMPILENVRILNMTGNGIDMLADNTINVVDDTYAVVNATLTAVTITGCTGWGLYQTRFASTFTARNLYINNCVSGGARIVAPHVNWEGGAVANNGGPGIRVTQAASAGGSSLSEAIFRSIEIDTNAVANVWFENGYNCTLESCRLITREVSGAYVTPIMVKLAGTSGMTVNGIKINKPYVRATQTVNPALTVFEFNTDATYCKVIDYVELAGISTARVLGTRSGVNNTVQNVTGEYIFSDTDKMDNAFAQAYLNAAVTVSTAEADIIWPAVNIDRVTRYNTATGEYQFKDDNGVFRVSGFITVDGTGISSQRWVRIALRFNPNSGYSTLKYVYLEVQNVAQNQTLPFDFVVYVSTSGATVKIAAVASTGTALLAGQQYSAFNVVKVN